MISLYKNHLGKISGVLLFFILFLLAGCYFSSAFMLFQLELLNVKPHILTQYSNLRILSADNQHYQKHHKKQAILNRDTLLLVIVIICIVVFTLGILICVICIVRVIFRLERTRTVGSSANGNQRNKPCYLKSWEGVQYEIFVDCLGQPYQTNCVICLEEFEYKNPIQIKIESDRREQQQKQQEKDEDKMREEINNGSQTVKKSNRVDNFAQVEQQIKKKETNTQQIPNNDKIMEKYQNKMLKTMKLTVCGHLLHSKCIQQWLQRQENCPMCRETFTQQNLKKWQKKLDIKIFQRDLVPPQHQQLQQTNQDINSLRNSIRNSSTSAQNYPTHQRAPLISSTNQTIQQIQQKQKNDIQESMQKNNIYSRMVYKIQQNKLPRSIKQILTTYAKIMAYHQKKRKQKQQNVLFFQSMQEQQVVNDITISGSIYERRQNMIRKHSVNSQSEFLEYNRPRKRKRSNKNRQMSPDRLQMDNLQIQIQYNNQ